MVLDERGAICLSVARPEFRERMRRDGPTLLASTLAERRRSWRLHRHVQCLAAPVLPDPDGSVCLPQRGILSTGLVPLPPRISFIEKGEAGDAT